MKIAPRESTQERLLRVEEVGHRLGVSERTVWRLANSRQLAKPLSIGRCRRWRKADVDAYVESLRVA